MTASRGRSRWVLAATVMLLLLGYGAWVVVLRIGSDGLAPPSWRVADLPTGAEVVRQEKRCDAGHCWRSVILQPARGRSPVDLAREMGVTSPSRSGWAWNDPHPVRRASAVRAIDFCWSSCTTGTLNLPP